MELDKDSGWLQGVRTCPSPFFNERPNKTDIDLVVLHNISLPEGQFGTPYIEALFTGQLDSNAHPSFANIDQRVASHLVIDRKGLLTQYVSLYDRAWHAGVSSFAGRNDCNDFSVGIELEGCDDRPFTEMQYHCLQKILQLLLQELPRLTVDRIVGHEHVAPGRKTDPGPHFNWRCLVNLLRERNEINTNNS